MRSCGSCTACCTLTFVPELQKLENTTCKHCDKGCTIYEDRPRSCREYRCAWLDSTLSVSMKPDVCGVIIEIYPRMVAALLVPGFKITDLDKNTLSELDKFVVEGRPVIVTGQLAKLPIGMTAETAKQILLDTVREMRGT